MNLILLGTVLALSFMGYTTSESSFESQNETLKIARITPASPNLNSVADMLDKQPVNNIDVLNWQKKFPYAPKVQFSIAHNDTVIYIKYTVREEYTMAKTTQDNGAVYTDSCVEFFFSPDDGRSYYNFEFACNGTALLGYCKVGNDKESGPLEMLRLVERIPSLGTGVIKEFKGDNKWTITVAIPVSVLYNHDIKSLSGLKATANFYKCGDKLTKPHYLSWNPIKYERPNFHLPQFFGKVMFE